MNKNKILISLFACCIASNPLYMRGQVQAVDPQVKKQMLEELRQIHEKEKEEFLKVYTRNPQYTIISHMNSVLTLETPKGELWSFTRID